MTARQPTWVEQLADWLLVDRDVPDEVSHAAERATLDAVACAAGAVDHPAGMAMRRVVERLGGNPECALLFEEARTSLPHAVLYNATLVRALDHNDIYYRAGPKGHPSDNVPAALAVAAREHANGQDFVRSVATGYELFCRLQELLRGVTSSPWDYVSFSGLVSAAIAGMLGGLDRDCLAHALALGGAQTLTPRQVRRGEISMAKAVVGALASQAGLIGYLCATSGMTGPLGLLESADGLLAGAGIEPTADACETLLGPVGRWRILDVSTKPYPAIGTSQAAVSGILDLVIEHDIVSEQVDQIEVLVPDSSVTRQHLAEHARSLPDSRESADHSIPFLLAVALEDRELTPRQFANQRWLDPTTRDLLQRVRQRPSADLCAFDTWGQPAVVAVRLRDGRRLTREVLRPPGSPENPEDDVALIRKFVALAGSVLEHEAATGMAQALLGVGSCHDVATLVLHA
ncbi:MAG TPA: MmgE/PrpD family protein [Galbitalea sp.]